MKHGMKIAALSLAVVMGLSACGSSNNEEKSFDFAATEMITNLSNDVIVAGYKDLVEKADALVIATHNLVNETTQDNLHAAQKAWVAARSPWEQGESHIFGPIEQLNIDPHLDSWPLATSDLEAILAGTKAISAASIKKLGDNVQGYHTMEFLLFGDGVKTNDRDIADFTKRQANYLSATAEIFRDYTKDLVAAWVDGTENNAGGKDTPFQESFKSANNDIYGSQLAVIEELITGMFGIVDEVGNGKIANPFAASIDDADTSLVESQYSWNSLTDFADNITGVLNVYNGEFTGEADEQGIYDFVAAGDKVLADRVKMEIIQAIADIKAIGGADGKTPFRNAIKDPAGRKLIQKSIDSLTTLHNSLKVDVIELMKTWSAK